MTYRLDDEGGFWSAVVAAGNEAYGACVRAGQMCAKEGSGGEFSRAVALAIALPKVWDRAQAHGLVIKLEKGAYRLCDELYLNWNPSAEQAKEIRGKRAAAGELGGRRSGETRRGKPDKQTPAPDEANAKQSASSFAYQSAQQEVKQRGLGSGLGSDLRSESDARGAAPLDGEQEIASVRSDSAQLPQNPALDVIAEAIRAQAEFAMLDARRIARSHCQFMVAKPQRIRDVVRAIGECAAKSEGLGLNAQALQAKLVGFMRHAAPPREGSAAKDARMTQEASLHDGRIQPVSQVVRVSEVIPSEEEQARDPEAAAKARRILGDLKLIGNGGMR